MNKLEYRWVILTQWFLNLASQWKHLESFRNKLMIGPTPRYSDLIGLESNLGIRGFQISPDDVNAQQSLRITINSLKVIGLIRQKSWFCWPQSQFPSLRNYLCLYQLKSSEDIFISNRKGWFLRNKQTVTMHFTVIENLDWMEQRSWGQIRLAFRSR